MPLRFSVPVLPEMMTCPLLSKGALSVLAAPSASVLVFFRVRVIFSSSSDLMAAPVGLVMLTPSNVMLKRWSLLMVREPLVVVPDR